MWKSFAVVLLIAACGRPAEQKAAAPPPSSAPAKTAASTAGDALRALGARAQAAVVEHFNVEKEAQRYVEVLRTCAADRRLRAAR